MNGFQWIGFDFSLELFGNVYRRHNRHGIKHIPGGYRVGVGKRIVVCHSVHDPNRAVKDGENKKRILRLNRTYRTGDIARTDQSDEMQEDGKEEFGRAGESDPKEDEGQQTKRELDCE